MKAKYITIDADTPYAVAFGPTISHKEMAHRLDVTDRILGAGFFSVESRYNEKTGDSEVLVMTFGESESLKRCPNEFDAFIIKWIFRCE